MSAPESKYAAWLNKPENDFLNQVISGMGPNLGSCRCTTPCAGAALRKGGEL